MKKFLVCFCVICMIFSMGTVAFAFSGEIIVESESNDSISEANNVQIMSSKSYHVVGVVSKDDKEDWFKVNPIKTGEGFFNLDEGAGIDCSIYLYDENGRLIASGRRDIDHIYISSNSVYYVKVKYDSGASKNEPYKLQITVI
ncbi:hypothetical protein [Paramaledivibacter caminithermalis]|uniref:Uncharacterized protein n=1 Tax=Paramaledivibacter caminithermalis (strain DSM 15212 / CIP 107654 / DViRD3) TaxID=1121301 RepID=A0A1M6KEZ7_PARC5|nr:hypothetical protein [Paramaledivibacter caminithermalis]SHJ57565.1 hypothetical protein SAMN02745912_00368 [Paramaledivibacter caminithermalis DSM 15212]